MENRHGMANQSYYRLRGGEVNVDNDRCDESERLIVNCCGETVMRQPWRHQSTRLRRDYYLLLSLGGTLEARIGTERVSIRSGELICIAPGTGFMLGSLDPMDEWTRYFWIHFTGSEAEKLLSDSGLVPNRVYDTHAEEGVFFYYERLFEEFRSRGADFDYAAALHLRYILLVLGRACRADGSGRRLDKSLRYIHTHIRYDLSVEKLAAMEYLGVSSYRRLFRECTGASPVEYIIGLRMERAKDLLRHTDMSIDKISEGVGYVDRHYFQNTFKRCVGMTPTEYRRGKGS